MTGPDSALERRRRRAAWRCRRGLKELDLLLEPFVRERLPALDEADLDELERLLDAGDQAMLRWLTGSPALDPGRRRICELITGRPGAERDGRNMDPGDQTEGRPTAPARVGLERCASLRIRGADAQAFLQGQLTCDVREVDAHRSRLAAWCTPKGRVVACGRLLRLGDGYVWRIPRAQAANVASRLRLYVLRAAVEIDDVSPALTALGLVGADERLAARGVSVPPLDAPDAACPLGDAGEEGAVVRVRDRVPRLEVIGPTGVLERLAGELPEVPLGVWVRHDCAAGLPWLDPALAERFLPQMLNLDLLAGVSFDKGCYVGQEIVARTQHLGRLKRRLFVGRVATPEPVAPGDALYDARAGNEQSAGTVVSAARERSDLWCLLAVAGVDRESAGPLRLRHVLGPPVTLRAAPYAAVAGASA